MRSLHYLAALLFAVLLVACGGGGGSPGTTANSQALFTTAPSGLTLTLGSAQSFTVGGGRTPYTVASNDSTIVVPSLSGSSLTLGAASPGSASVTIRDAAGATASVAVTIKPSRALFTTAPSSVTMGVGLSSAQTYQVGGGAGPYTLTSSNTNAISAVLTGGNLTITGLAAGSGDVQLMDSVGATVVIAVTVSSTPTLDLYTTASPGVTLPNGSSATYSVGGGTAPYTVTSANTSIATVSLSGNSLTINAMAAGTTPIVIRDSTGATVTANVTVAPASSLFTTAPQDVTIGVGAAPVYTVGGGVGPYTAMSSNAGIATVSLSGSSLVITGVATGAATVVLRDSAGATLNIAVTVSTAAGAVLFTTAPPAITLAIGPANAQTYSIGGGSAPYTATSSNTTVASAALAGSAVTITGLAIGSANVVIRDSAGSSVTVAVTVSSGQLTVSPSGATALVGDTLFANISGGSGSYTALVTNAAVATASVSGSTLRVDVKQQAAGVPIIITDTVTGLTTQFTLTSAPGQTQIQLSPNALTISERSTGPITLQVYGNNGAVTAFSSDTALLQVTGVSGNTVTINTGTNLNRCVTGNKTVTISVIDSTNALATSLITISDSVAISCP